MFYFGCNSVQNNNSDSSNKNISSNISNNVKIGDYQNQPLPKDLLITLETTDFWDNPAVYKLSIKADGSVIFEGIKNTETKGIAEGKISDDKIRELLREFDSADYFNLQDNYGSDNCPSMATDHSTVITSIQIADKKKRISHYLGCFEKSSIYNRFPPKLYELENKIAETVEVRRWIGERK